VACLLQGAALATAAMLALVALAMYRPLHSAATVAGAPCSNQYGVLSLLATDGQWSDRMTWRQFAALRATRAFIAYPIATVGLEFSDGRQTRDATFIGMEPAAVAHLCIRGRNEEQLPDDGGVLTTDAALAKWARVRVGVSTMPVIGTLDTFRGFDQDGPHIDGIIPIDRLPDAGFDLKGADLGVLRVLVPRNVPASALDEARLGAAAAFRNIARFEVNPNIGMSASEVASLRNLGGALFAITASLALLAMVNIITYQIGRQPEIGWRIKILRDLGAPASSRRLLAFIEPAVITAIAMLIAVGAAAPVLRGVLYVAQADRLGTLVAVRPMDAAIVAALLAFTAVLIGEMRTRIAARTFSRRVRRIADRAFDYLATIEGAAALAALLFAGAATIVYLRSAPARPSYDMNHVRVYTVQLRKADKVPADFGVRAPRVLENIAAEVNGVAAIADDFLPVQSTSFETMSLQIAGKAVLGEINRVTDRYFDVLRLKVSGAFTASDASPDGRHEASGGVANKALMDLLGSSASSQHVVAALTPRAEKMPQLFTIRGSFDERTSGNDSGNGDFAMMPTLYVPYDKPHWGLKSYNLFVRYAPGFSRSAVDRSAMHAIDDLTPNAHVETRDLAQVFLDATKRERMSGMLFNIMAVGALAMCVCGVLALGTMRFTLSKMDYAVRFTMGATRDELIINHMRRFLVPLLIGVLIAGGLFAMASERIAEGFHMSTADVWLAGAGGVVLLITAATMALLTTVAPIRRGGVVAWLKTEV